MDIRKEYDSVEWPFLKMVLLEFGIPYKLVELIMGCVSTVNYSLLLNEGLTPSFQAKKGLRQGDPMSFYLFFLAMEYLNRSLKRADRHYIQMMLHCFEHFSDVSGLKANMEKSCLYIAGVTPDFISDLTVEFHFTVGNLTISQCMPLVEKIAARVKCWTSRFLSYRGRLQLIKSVLFEMQTYWAQVFLIPKKVHTLVTSICRNYLRSGSKENSRKALVSWETLCKPKSAGGLNILDFYTWNKAVISKLLWAVSMNKNQLWVRCIHSYYIKGRRLEDMVIPKQSSWIVRKIIAAREWFSTVIESHEHLFFDCGYSQHIWAAILQWVGMNKHIGHWHSEVEWLGKKVRSKRPWNAILGFLFAATIYQIWMERNNRRFNKQKKKSESLIRDIAL
ncbi:uncharacterized protein LOC132613180 [Lycium barbarum]|uniref:uncharacterized protein LOC132613180 n=1 Tax=Lycium barbarum TaxID=112863 RepID=UPI00293F5C0A|nr:uncharacterized protein LOC132613180 [Lycium barbarum]